MDTQKVSNILSIVLSILTILCAISVFLGSLCTNLLATGFFAYLLNIFAAPILMIFPVFVGFFGGLWVIYLIVAIFLVVGIVDLLFAIKAIKRETITYSHFIVNYVCSIMGILLCIFVIFSICVNGFKILSDSSIWSVFWLILFVIGIIWSFVLKTIMLAKINKE